MLFLGLFNAIGFSLLHVACNGFAGEVQQVTIRVQGADERSQAGILVWSKENVIVADDAQNTNEGSDRKTLRIQLGSPDIAPIVIGRHQRITLGLHRSVKDDSVFVNHDARNNGPWEATVARNMGDAEFVLRKRENLPFWVNATGLSGDLRQLLVMVEHDNWRITDAKGQALIEIADAPTKIGFASGEVGGLGYIELRGDAVKSLSSRLRIFKRDDTIIVTIRDE